MSESSISSQPSESTESNHGQSSFIRERIIGDGPLIPVILRLAWPVVMMMYLQGAYNIIDGIWVGQLLGKLALAGIAAGGFVLWAIFGITNFVSVGIMAIVARRIGENNQDEAESVTAKGIAFAFVLSIIVGLILWFLLPYMFVLMGTGSEVTSLGSEYLRVLLTGSPLIFLSFVFQRVFQAAGDTTTPMWIMFLTLVINAALDPVLMLGLFGLPGLGVAGAALATVISRFFMVSFSIWLLLNKRRIILKHTYMNLLTRIPVIFPRLTDGYLRLRPLKLLEWNWSLLRSVLRIGFPPAVSQILFPLVYMVITRLPASYGPQHIASLRIGHTVEGISFYLAWGLAIATATCVGQNLGARKPERAVRAGLISAGIICSILLIFSLCFFVFSKQIGSIFTSDPSTIVASAVYLKILSWSQIFMGLEIVLGGVFTGAGDTKPIMAIVVPFNLARIPLAFLLAVPAGFGVNGAWWAISGTSIIKGLLIALWFQRGGWKGKNLKG